MRGPEGQRLVVEVFPVSNPRQRLSQTLVHSTFQQRGSTTKPLACRAFRELLAEPHFLTAAISKERFSKNG
jgi:hypothetical protein